MTYNNLQEECCPTLVLDALGKEQRLLRWNYLESFFSEWSLIYKHRHSVLKKDTVIIYLTNRKFNGIMKIQRKLKTPKRLLSLHTMKDEVFP